MDPNVTIIVSALALGAAAGLKELAGEAVKDAYNRLRALVERNYGGVKVELLEGDPGSGARRQVIQEELEKTEAGEDEALLLEAQKVIEAVEQYAPETAAEIHIKLEDVKVEANLRIARLQAEGGRASVDVDVKGAEVGKDFELTDIEAVAGGKVAGGNEVADAEDSAAARTNIQISETTAGRIIFAKNYIAAEETPGIWAGVPAMPRRFVGRDELMQGLIERMTSGESLALSAEGLPGAGKTALAVALAHHKQVLEHFEDGVLWAGLGTKADVMSALASWAGALGIDVSDLLEAGDRKLAVKQAIGQRRLLLVIDDAWDIKAAKMLACGGPYCCHLLTTRDKGIARAFAGVSGEENVPTLEDDPAYTLLQEMAPEACRADPEAARGLVQAVGGLPLALELLGGYLAAPERSLFPDLSQEALAKMTDPKRRLALAQERLGAPGLEVTLGEAIKLSLEGLWESEEGVEAERAFYALGAFAPKPERFSREAAEAVAEVKSAIIALLVARNLVAYEGEELALHQTVADVAREKVEGAAVDRHRDYYLELVNENREDWRWIEAAYGQVQWAWQQAPDDEGLLELVWALCTYQIRRGLWEDFLDWHNRGLSVAQAHQLGENEGALLNNIGHVYNSLGQREQALEYYNRALPIREEVGDRAGLAVTLNNIGAVYDNLGQREQALAFYNRALPIREEVGDRAGLATTLNNIGTVYDSLGQQEQALEFYNRALPISEEVGDRYMVATTLNNIGSVHNSLGQQEQALEFYNQALPIREEVGDRAGLAVTLNNIGRVYDNLGQREQALDFYNRALPISEEVGDRSMMATTLNNIGAVYNSLGQREQALAYYNRALPIREEVGDRAGLASTLSSIGLVYDNLGQREQALEFYNRALPISEEVGDRYIVATTLSNIGLVYDNLGQREQALEFYNRALPISEEVGDRAGLATTLNNIGTVYNSLGQREQALAYYNQALPILVDVGNRYVESITRYNMALIYWAEDRLQEAVTELERVVELDRLVQHPDLESDLALLNQVKEELAGQG